MTKVHYFFFLFICLISPQFVQAQNAPDFTFTDTEGVSHNLQERLDAGFIIVLDFFYVNCPPCVDTGIELEAIHNDYQGKNVEVWSISPYDSIPAIQEFQENHNFTYIAGGIEGGGWDIIEIYVDSLGLQYYPTISVICPNGDLTWDIWPYTSNGAPEWRGPIEACGVYDINITAATEDFISKYPSSLFPNPAEDLINVEFYTENAKDVLVEIYDITGRKLIQQSIAVNNAGQQNEQISVASLFSGNYVLRLSTEGKSLSILPFQK
jgi:thiol-disulfide isomerase/thioredoxin